LILRNSAMRLTNESTMCEVVLMQPDLKCCLVASGLTEEVGYAPLRQTH
jgi:hypothetical protein